MAVWLRSNGTNTIAQAAGRPAGGSWQTHVDLSAAGADALAPLVAVDPQGGAVAVWERQMVPQAAVRSPTGDWQAPTNLSAGCQVPPAPRIAVSPQGAAMAAWTCWVGSSPVIMTSLRPAGGGWEPAVNLTPYDYAQSPEVAFDPGGKAIALWALASPHILQSATRPPGAGWQPRVTVPTGPSPSEHQIVTDSLGNAFASWRRAA